MSAQVSGYYFEHVSTVPFERGYPAASVPGSTTFENTLFGLGSGLNGHVYAIPFIEGRGHTYRWIAIRMQTASTSGTAVCRIGIYRSTSNSNLYPSSLVLDAGEVTLNSISPRARKIFVQFSLEASTLYWFVTQFGNITTSTGAVTASTGDFAILGRSSGDLSTLLVGWADFTQTYGVLPSTFFGTAFAVRIGGGLIELANDGILPEVYVGVDTDLCP